MKKFIMYFVILLLLFYTGYVYLNNDLNVASGMDISEVSPFQNKLNREVKLFFIYEDQLLYETRRINYEKSHIVDEAIKQLKAGPKVKKYEKGISDGITIQSVVIENRVCYVNFSEEFAFEIISDKELGLLRVWSVVNTLCDLREVDSVLLLSDGEKLNIEIGDIYLGENLFSNNDYAKSEDRGPTEFVDLFLSRVNEKRYDLAYEMIDYESKRFATYESFIEDMETYTDTYTDMRRGVQFSQRSNERVFVFVKYIKVQIDESVRDTPVFKSYEVIEEDGQWRIKYIDFDIE